MVSSLVNVGQAVQWCGGIAGDGQEGRCVREGCGCLVVL